MKDPVRIVGIGCTPVGELWNQSLADLAVTAIENAMQDACVSEVGALVVGNMLADSLCSQSNIAAMIADRSGLRKVEAHRVEAACASGGAALRVGAMMVQSGLHSRVAVLGVEKMTDSSNAAVLAGLAKAADFDSETIHGATFAGLNAMLTRMYATTHGISESEFARGPIESHAKAVHVPHAMFREPIDLETYLSSPMVASPLRLLDCAPVCDGAAAVILSSDSVSDNPQEPIKILSIGAAVDCVAFHQRPEPLVLSAVRSSACSAFEQAGLAPNEIDLFELHDAFPIMTALSIEAMELAAPGKGLFFKSPMQTMGGLKARGHPVGATGVYQVVEACLQLRGKAGKNQVPDVNVCLTQALGGVAASAFTTILAKESFQC